MGREGGRTQFSFDSRLVHFPFGRVSSPNSSFLECRNHTTRHIQAISTYPIEGLKEGRREGDAR